MKKRLLSLLLVIVIVLGMFPMHVLAANASETTTITVPELDAENKFLTTVWIKTISLSDVVLAESREWFVDDVEYSLDVPLSVETAPASEIDIEISFGAGNPKVFNNQNVIFNGEEPEIIGKDGRWTGKVQLNIITTLSPMSKAQTACCITVSTRNTPASFWP